MFGGGQGGGFMLLAIPKVQEELKLTDEQKSQLQAIGEKIQADFQKARENMQNLSEEEREKKQEELRAEAEKRFAEIRKQIGEILKPEQTKRLRQIQLQQQGTAALMDPVVAEELKLTEAQKADLSKLREDFQAQMQARREARRGEDRQGPPSQEQIDQFRKAREEADAKVMAVLTDAQKQTLRDMMGEPFEMPRFEGGPGRGGRGGRGN
jgi:Spy/CpxP family protein refolding chaperone